MDADLDGQDDEWIIDDLGGGMKDKTETEREEGYAREMGTNIVQLFFICRPFILFRQ